MLLAAAGTAVTAPQRSSLFQPVLYLLSGLLFVLNQVIADYALWLRVVLGVLGVVFVVLAVVELARVRRARGDITGETDPDADGA